jgi:hypothetical protein
LFAGCASTRRDTITITPAQLPKAARRGFALDRRMRMQDGTSKPSIRYSPRENGRLVVGNVRWARPTGTSHPEG